MGYLKVASSWLVVCSTKSHLRIELSLPISVRAQTELQWRQSVQRQVVQGEGGRQGDGQLLHLHARPAGEGEEADQAQAAGNQRAGQSDIIYFWTR